MSRLSFGSRRKPEHHEVSMRPTPPPGNVRLYRKKAKPVKADKIGRNWIWPAIGFLVFVEVLLLGGHAVQWARASRHFELSEMVIAGHQAIRPEDIVKLTGLKPGSNIFDARSGIHPQARGFSSVDKERARAQAPAPFPPRRHPRAQARRLARGLRDDGGG